MTAALANGDLGVHHIQYHYRVTVVLEGSKYTRDYRIVADCEEEARDKGAKLGAVVRVTHIY